MTAPTGIGKTQLAANWALVKRETIEKETGIPPKIIVVLPYLSIIDQTAKEYRSLLEIGGQDIDGSWFLTSHSLSDRKFAPWMEAKTEHFFIDTWRTELVITTYDQFLLSLIEPRARYQMRFHNLCDALIIMDEVQSLPCKLWQLLDAVLNSLSKTGNSQTLLMSATLPPFVSNSIPLLENHEKYFRSFSRYELHLNISKKLHIQTFYEDLAARMGDWLTRKERVLITMNTRKCARIVFDYLKECWPEKYKTVPIFFISADVTPKDRLNKIGIIKNNKPCVVVSTQCIEAGVDIDMGIVIRDFAPWDSIVQIAGRCNREGTRGKWIPVEIVNLVNEKGNRYSEMIYDEVALQVTKKLLESFSVIKEEDVLSISDQYFKELDRLKDTGNNHLKRFAQWQEDVSVRELLRGKDREQYSFLVIEQDHFLKKAMTEANSIDDRWKRREAWRKLSGRSAEITVNLYARSGFSPNEIASDFLGHWLLRDGYYDSERGIMLENKAWKMNGDTLVF
jgi:CRISPR-associated endonuclease/helicase Cas3